MDEQQQRELEAAQQAQQRSLDATLYGFSVTDAQGNRVDPRALRPSEGRVTDLRNGPDLPVFLTMREMSMIGMFATKLAIDQGYASDIDDVVVGILVRDRGPGSNMPAPWIEFSVGDLDFAFWRRTMDLYEVHDGAVDEDPIHRNEQ